MPTIIKVTSFFSQSEGYGWTESHYQSYSSTNPNLETALNNYQTNVVPLRAAILDQASALVGTRVSYPRNGSIASQSLRVFTPGEPLAQGASPSLSLAVAMIDGTNTRSKIIHVRGFWDSVELNGTYRPEFSNPPNFAFRLAQWKDALIIGGYGWPSKDPALSSNGPVVGYSSSAGDFVTFILGGAGMPPATVGTVQQVRFSRLNNSKSVLNRSILVSVIDVNTLRTIQPYAASAFSGQGKFNFRGVSFVAYAKKGSVSLGERRMGKPLNRYPGRAKARPTA